MTVVIGTAGHIDHGKTTLLRALTGIDADRLPEERRRGMTIDVGYAHLALPDGTELDFVDVPGHDRLVGNMLVGAGEIDAAMLVVAADDGPRAQTIEHLELLDALGIQVGLAVITKLDLAGSARADEVAGAVRALLARTTLRGSPILAASSFDGSGLEELRSALVRVRDRALAGPSTVTSRGTSRLAVDRSFTVKGRGAVVTGTLRGGPLVRSAALRVVPGAPSVRARELQVHGAPVESAERGRVAINVGGIESADLHRGVELTDDPSVGSTDRLLVRLARPMPDRMRARVHIGTASVDGVLGRSGRDAIDLADGSVAGTLRLVVPIAAAPGDRFVLRRASGAERIVGGTVLDLLPPRGISRRRQTTARVAELAHAVERGDPGVAAAARLAIHGAIAIRNEPVALAADVVERLTTDILASFDDAGGTAPETAARAPARNTVPSPVPGGRAPSRSAEHNLPSVRTIAARSLRRLVTLDKPATLRAASAAVEWLVEEGRLVREGATVRLPGSKTADAEDPALVAAMDRLERALSLAAPPPLAAAASGAGCSPAGIQELERAGRIVRIEPDLAYATATFRHLALGALEQAGAAPLTPAALRDATGTSRRYVMALLEELDRRGILRRTDAGHVPGPRAATAAGIGR